MRALLILLFLFISGCFSGSVKPALETRTVACTETPVKVGDLSTLGFNVSSGKVVVVRLMRINCPFCREDLLHMGALFQSGKWTKEHIQIFLIAYRKEGVEDRRTFDKFMREELPDSGVPMEAVQAVYLDKDYYTLVKARNAHGDLLFESWRGVPFGLVFALDGRLAYRGQFTSSPGADESQYKFITELQTEKCAQK